MRHVVSLGFVVLLNCGCASHDWRALHAVLDIGAALAPGLCRMAGGAPEDCRRVEEITRATDEARRALQQQCGTGAPSCARAAVDAAERASELAEELRKPAARGRPR